jgi:pimeloyl-ACP methyl ester carboxylesterase
MMRVVAAVLLALVAACDRTPLDERVFEMGLQVERERAGFERKEVEFDGFRLAYLERPADGETVVLLHGFASEKDAWTRFARHMPREYRVIAVDLPGHGESTRRMEDIHDVPYLVARLAQGFDAMGLERFHIAGNSLGGMAAVLYAHDHPERVLTLGLFAAAGVRPSGESEFERMLQRGENPLIVDSREEFDRLMDLVFEERPPMPWPIGEVLERRYAERAAFHEKMWEDIWGRAEVLTGLLPDVSSPTLVVWGDSDRILHPSSLEVFARWLPRAEFEVMLHTGHSPMIERPSRSAAIYVDFLRRSGRESAGSAAARSGP